jgi:hypothetical protein
MANDQIQSLTRNQTRAESTALSALVAFMEGHALRNDSMIPAQVISFDRANNVAVVQPMIMWVDVAGNSVPRAQIANIPVLSLGGGGYHISFPIQPGDLGWIFASDRDLSIFKQNLSMAVPSHGRMRSFSDSFFIPDVFRKYTIQGADTNAMVIQSTNGDTRIAIDGNEIRITAPGDVLVDTPTATFTGNVNIQKNLTVTQNTSVTGSATITGATTANGGFTAASGQPCTLPSTATAGGINLNNHGHTQTAVNGQRTSGGMIS